jgi:hypothetical protein
MEWSLRDDIAEIVRESLVDDAGPYEIADKIIELLERSDANAEAEDGR